jgi:broad specificity phosphatase PhoE
MVHANNPPSPSASTRHLPVLPWLLLALGACALLGALWWWLGCRATTTLLVVRHGDRAGAADALSPPGTARAHALVHVGEHAGVKAIYHSDTVRTRDTALPIATALNLVPLERPANAVSELVDEIFDAHRGEAVLVVGHSNTVPEIIAAAGGPRVPALADDEFDKLFVLSACGCWSRSATLVTLQYGAASQ